MQNKTVCWLIYDFSLRRRFYGISTPLGGINALSGGNGWLRTGDQKPHSNRQVRVRNSGAESVHLGHLGGVQDLLEYGHYVGVSIQFPIVLRVL